MSTYDNESQERPPGVVLPEYADTGHTFDLTGPSGNSISIVTSVASTMGERGASEERIVSYCREAMRLDYLHLLRTSGLVCWIGFAGDDGDPPQLFIPTTSEEKDRAWLQGLVDARCGR